MFKKFICLLFIMIIGLSSYAKHEFKESEYQKLWCRANNGKIEYKNEDGTRVDCLTKDYAVEFDFAKKWAESIGQALHYEIMTGRKAKIVLILENTSKEMKYFERTKVIGEKYGIEVEYVTKEIFR